jgi:hypothetical protein
VNVTGVRGTVVVVVVGGSVVVVVVGGSVVVVVGGSVVVVEVVLAVVVVGGSVVVVVVVVGGGAVGVHSSSDTCADVAPSVTVTWQLFDWKLGANSLNLPSSSAGLLADDSAEVTHTMASGTAPSPSTLRRPSSSSARSTMIESSVHRHHEQRCRHARQRNSDRDQPCSGRDGLPHRSSSHDAPRVLPLR